MGPLVSILLPVYNSVAYIESALNSILLQTYQNIELILINDGCNDGTELILQDFSNKYSYVRLINQENLGYCQSLNNGVELCKGKYIARMDADDIMHPSRIELQLKYLELNPNVSILGTAIQYIDVHNNHQRRHIYPTRYSLPKSIFEESPLAHPSVMMRKEIFDQIGKYRANMFPAEDYDLWLRAHTQNIVIDNLKDVLMYYRVHNSNTSSNNSLRRAYASICAQKGSFLRLNGLPDGLDGVDVLSGSYFNNLPAEYKPTDMEIFSAINSTIKNIDVDKALTKYEEINFHSKDDKFRVLFLLRVAFFYFSSIQIFDGLKYLLKSLMISISLTVCTISEKYRVR
jgi:glycosyltransferase involved in cell wall biosynthesis